MHNDITTADGEFDLFQNVTLADVQRVARTYFTDTGRMRLTIMPPQWTCSAARGWSDEPPHARSLPSVPSWSCWFVASLRAMAQSWPTEGPPPPLAARRVDFPRYELQDAGQRPAGAGRAAHEQPSVSFRMLVRAGRRCRNRRGGRVWPVSSRRCSTRARRRRSARQIADTIDSAGGSLGVGSANELTLRSGRRRQGSDRQALALMADMHPQSGVSPSRKSRCRAAGALGAAGRATTIRTTWPMPCSSRLVFGTHPYGRPGQGTPESINRITRADLRGVSPRPGSSPTTR